MKTILDLHTTHPTEKQELYPIFPFLLPPENLLLLSVRPAAANLLCSH